MAARRSNAKRRAAGKKKSGGIPAWFWLLGGIFIGLGTAVVLMFRGYLPEFESHTPEIDKPVASASGPAIIKDKEQAKKPEKPRYDFFTVLPEMEVVVPEQELQRKAAAHTPEPVANVSNTNAAASTSANSNTVATKTVAADKYILQVGSFQNSSEAEQMKAQLAMIGFSANVQTVNVDGQSWHRIRVGPFEGAREAEDMRQLLADNQFAPLVMKAK